MPTPVKKSVPMPRALCSLPAFRPVVVKMLQLLNREDESLGAIGNLVQSDPALGAEILAMSNSPLYGLTATIRTVKHAITVLGAEQVRKLASAVALKTYAHPTADANVLRTCWTHSIATAVLGEELAPQFRVAPQLAYAAGLLHDIGRLGMLMAFPKQYAELSAADGQNAGGTLETECELFGFDHATAGQWLTRAWLLPPEFQQVCGCHHEPGPFAGTVVAVVAAGCALAEALGFPEAAGGPAPDADAISSCLPPAASALVSDEDLKARLAKAVSLAA